MYNLENLPRSKSSATNEKMEESGRGVVLGEGITCFLGYVYVYVHVHIQCCYIYIKSVNKIKGLPCIGS